MNKQFLIAGAILGVVAIMASTSITPALAIGISTGGGIAKRIQTAQQRADQEITRRNRRLEYIDYADQCYAETFFG